MIKVERLIELLKQIPQNADVNAYEGEDCGIAIRFEDKFWWIRARESDEIDNHTSGFEIKQNEKNL